LLLEATMPTSPIERRTAQVAFRVRAVRLSASHKVCFPGLCSSPPSPAVTAASNTNDVAAPPSCIVA
jgi:hypothetical protein